MEIKTSPKEEVEVAKVGAGGNWYKRGKEREKEEGKIREKR